MTTSPRQAAATPEVARRSLDLYAPLRIALVWLIGTYVLFLLVGLTVEVDHFAKMNLFIAGTVVALTLGYRGGVSAVRKRALPTVTQVDEREVRTARLLVLVGAVYFAIYGLALLRAYGATSLGDFLSAATNPGDSYRAKFDIFATQQAEGIRNPVIQVATILAALSTPVVPFLVLYWRRLPSDARIAACAALALYASYFVYIGTLKGLGDIVIYAAAATLIVRKGVWRGPGQLSRGTWIAIVALILGFLGYMVFAQASRLDTFDAGSAYKPNPIARTVLGDDLAKGVTVTIGYPTNGYVGLSKNLDTPFQWTYGRGNARAFESYWVQYIGGPSIADNTYPERTERRTGYPAGMYWATVYPWLASDLHWLGTIGFMFIVGWWLARLWFEAAFERRRLSVLLFSQVAMFIAFVPANNQIGLGRTSLIAFVTLVVLYASASLGRKRQQENWSIG